MEGCLELSAMIALAQHAVTLLRHPQKPTHAMDKLADDALVVVTLGTVTLIVCLSLLFTL
jgi:hypothetical protein